MEFVAEAETAQRVDHLTDDDRDELLDAVASHRGRITRSLLGRARLVVTVHAEDLTHAIAVAGAVLTSVAGSRELVSLSVIRSRDAELVSGLPPSERWLSVSEYADRTAVSRQAVLQQIAAGTLPATKVGTTWVVVRPERRGGSGW